MSVPENMPQARQLFIDSQATVTWFAGTLEVGAIATIGVSQYRDQRGILRDKTQPYIEIHSTSQPMLDRLYAVYGGMRRSRFWNKGGQVAAEIVASTLPSTVARQEHALAMQNWLNAETIEEKIVIARDLQAQPAWQQRGDEEAYQDLLTNPTFVAGVLDCRAYIGLRPSKNYHTLYIQITSKNLALLNSLESKFGGWTRMTEPAGIEVHHGDVVFATQIDTHVWEAVGSEAIELVTFASPFLQTSPPEGWGYQRAIERQEEVQQLAERIAEQARREMEQLRAGEIPKLSTDPVLAEMFGIYQRTLSQYLRRILTPAERKARYDTIKRFARRAVDAVRTREVVEYLTEELLAYQRGERDRLSYGDNITERFGISRKVLTRHIIPQLDPEVSSTRLAILRSQITRERNLAYWQRYREKISQ